MAQIKRFFLFAILALFLFSIRGGAWVDTVQNYNTDYSEFWQTEGASITVSEYTYPLESYNQVLKVSSTVNSPGEVSYFRSINSFTNSFSFCMDRLYLCCTPLTYKHPYPYWVNIDLTDSNGDISASYNIITIPESDSLLRAGYDDTTPHLYEFSRVGSDIYFFIDGVNQGVFLSDDGDTAYYAQISYHTQYGTTFFYLDDLGEWSCIGITPEWNEILTTTAGTWKIDSYPSHSTNLYSLNLISLTSSNLGLINKTNISGATGAFSYNTSSTLADNYGLYRIDLLRDSYILASSYFVYYQQSNPLNYPDALFLAGSDVSTNILDNFATGETIDGGGSLYLYPEVETGNYQFTYTLQNNELSFSPTLESIYGDGLINSSLLTFEGLQNNYFITLNGADLPGLAASGNFLFSGNLSDGDLINISGDCYEFDNNSATLPGSIPVSLDSLNFTASAYNLLSNITTNSTANISASITTENNTILFITANDAGESGNLIFISSNSPNITASNTHLTGGQDSAGTTNGAASWSYNISKSDWANTTLYTFDFSPDFSQPGLYGYVKDADTNNPLKTATITIYNDSETFLLWTDSNGMFFLPGLMPGYRYSVKAAKTGYITFESSVTISTGAATQQDIFLSSNTGEGVYYASHDVTFSVWEFWNSGAGLPGASYAVYIDTNSDIVKSGLTDSTGAFVVEEMDTGTRYKIIITYNEQTYTKYYEPGLSSYTIILNEENIIHEYCNNWLNLIYEEGADSVNISYFSSEGISQTSLIATASDGSTVYSETRTTDNGNYTFSFSDDSYIISFSAVTASGLTASQSWAVDNSPSVDLFPSTYPDWLKNMLFVGIILIFLLAFGKARNDVACGSAAILSSLGYYFGWLICSFNFVILIWIISMGAVFVHYKRTQGTG